MNTVTVIETTKGSILAGFPRIRWASRICAQRDNNRESFLFTSRNPHNPSPQKFALLHPSVAIFCHRSAAPLFETGPDLYLANNSNVNANRFSNLDGYVNDTGINGNQVFAGECHFRVKGTIA
jgi:hypothetical protein